MNKVITRFAPSPTGNLHIGGCRTLLYNWLYAKKNNGQIILRIEDTDRDRSTIEATENIIKSIEWLGLQCDGMTIYQKDNILNHQGVVQNY
jgi:glutamyl-tRNA synthetase